MSRARSVVLSHVQRPYTLLGVPQRLLGLLIVPVSILSFGLFVGAFLHPPMTPVVLPSMGLMGAAAVVLCLALKRRDMHVETTLLLPPRFWKLRATRALTPGAPPRRAHGAKRPGRIERAGRSGPAVGPTVDPGIDPRVGPMPRDAGHGSVTRVGTKEGAR